VHLSDGSGSVPLFAPYGVVASGWAKAAEVEVDVVGRGSIPPTPTGREVQTYVHDHLADLLAGQRDEAAFTEVTLAWAQAIEAFGAAIPIVERMIITRI
jgi:hypothetical protein